THPRARASSSNPSKQIRPRKVRCARKLKPGAQTTRSSRQPHPRVPQLHTPTSLPISPSELLASSFLLPLRPLSSPTLIDPNSAEARRNETDLVRPISTARSNFLSPSLTYLKYLSIPFQHCRYVNGFSSMFPVV